VVALDVIVHSDNGGPMRGSTMLATLQHLGVVASFSRPSVSDDNPYIESLFRTLKYGPEYPHKPFESVEQARTWVTGFVAWYNAEHRHSGIRFVTPSVAVATTSLSSAAAAVGPSCITRSPLGRQRSETLALLRPHTRGT
jgi:hypothetical protein